ncbi:mitochondrial NADH:ubiquinone oxidoreductase 32 kDa subunit [Haematococcus lacustris]
MSLRHAGSLYPYRFPAPTGVIEKTLAGVGSLFRSLGVALDHFGAMVQGPGAVKETVQPNLAWAPVKYDPARPPTMGQVVQVPAITRLPIMKEIVMPTKADGVFIAPSAAVLGDVHIGANSSIWYGAVLRGDVNSIKVGSCTNIQDNVVVHVAKHSIDGKPKPTVIGNNVTVGHCATLHACTIGDDCLVGMGSTVLDNCVVESGSIVAAGALVPPNTHIPSGQVWAGNPARMLRPVEEEELQFIKASARNYAELANTHKFENGKVFEEQFVEAVIESDRFVLSDPNNTVHQIWSFDAQTMIPIARKK